MAHFNEKNRLNELITNAEISYVLYPKYSLFSEIRIPKVIGREKLTLPADIPIV
jgi:hypothetical protein